MEGWYSLYIPDTYITGEYHKYWDQAMKTKNGQFRGNGLVWGAYKKTSKFSDWLDGKIKATWWTGDGSPAVASEPIDLGDGYIGEVIFTAAQRDACNSASCLGWTSK